MMTEKKRRIETGAIEDIVSQIKTEIEAKTIAHLALSEFGDKYSPELPDEMDKVIDKALTILQKIHEKGHDMRSYCIQMRNIVAIGYANYKGENSDKIWKYTLRVVDRVVYKSRIMQNKKGTKIRKKLF